MRFYLIFLLAVASFSCGNTPNENGINKPPVNANTKIAAVPVYDFQIVKEYPHDVTAFTQGLEYHDGFLYEGTGGSRSNPVQPNDAKIYSSLRKVEYTTGKVLQKHDVPSDFFGEGISVLGDKIFQITWHEGTAFVYNLSDFKLLKELRYPGQGWGLTNDGTNLYMSDGTHVIRVVSPEDFKNVRQLVVTDESGKPIMKLNELEMVNGEIWANIWQTGWIIRIDPQTGKLLGRIDINKLADDVKEKDDDADVLNGIAYDKAGDRLFITGKLWKKLYEIKVSVR
ncbi:MAG: glutaminyl-peptide cyclotransferase [Pyrinomonadaceae bacterium]